MDMHYDLGRFSLSILNEDDAGRVLSFYKKNENFFKPYEQEYPENFYTEEFQAVMLKAQLALFLKHTSVRYYITANDDSDDIIGCICFSRIQIGSEKSCVISYKIDKDHLRRRIAFDSSLFLMGEIKRSFDIHRIEADILRENEPSAAFVKSLGFCFEGVARSSHKVQGEWRDHDRYSLILD